MRLSWILAGLAFVAAQSMGASSLSVEACAGQVSKDWLLAQRCFKALARSGGEAIDFVETRRTQSEPAWNAISAALHWNQNWEAVVENYRAAAEGFEAQNRTNDARIARSGLSIALFELARYSESQIEAERAVELAQAVGDPERLVEAVTELLVIVGKTGDRAGAFKLLPLPEEAVAEAKPATRRAYYLRAANLLYSLVRREAWDYYEKLRQEAIDASDHVDEVHALYGQLGILEQKASDDPGAVTLADLRAWTSRILDRVDTRVAAASRPIAFLIRLSGDSGEADRLLEACLRVAKEERAKSYCLSARVRAATRFGDPKATGFALKAIARAQEHPDAVLIAWNEAMRASWVRGQAQESLTDSFEALSHIEAVRRIQREPNLQASLFSTWSDDYLWLSGKILHSAPDLLPTAFQVTERMRARSLLDQLSTSAPTADDFATLDEVRAALAPDEALLSYQIAPWVDWSGDFGGGSWLLAVTREGVKVHRLERDRTFWRQAVRSFVGLTTGRDGREEETAAALYGDLLGPALAELPGAVRRLVLVPDDVLHKLPFELLRERAGAPPLGERFAVTRVPSATLWQRWRQASAERPDRPGWIVADPAPLPAGPGGQILRQLPYARREGREVAGILGAGSRLDLGEAAAEALLLDQPRQLAGVLHFGTHAVVDEDDAERSAIYLGAGETADGRLELEEITGLPVAGQLVVLSSCESAAGVVLRGEGVLSLARAFFEGRRTRTVVASLWPLRDDDARAFFTHFYRQLAQGHTVAAAAQTVREELRHAGYPAEAWAGVVVLGDGELLPFPRRFPPPSMGVGLALLATGAAAWNRRRSA